MTFFSIKPRYPDGPGSLPRKIQYERCTYAGVLFAGPDEPNVCDHCGYVFTIGVAYNSPSGIVTLALKCSENLFGPDERRTKAVDLLRERLRGNERVERFCEAHPKGEALRDAFRASRNPTVLSIREALARKGTVSEDRVERAIYFGDPVTVAARKKAQAEARDQRWVHAVPVVAGRRTICGEVVERKMAKSRYLEGAPVHKMIVKDTTSGEILYGTCPTSIADDAVEGTIVEFQAEVTPSPGNPKFGLFFYPTAAKLVKRPPKKRQMS